MEDICLKLIGKPKSYILEYAREHSLNVEFLYTKGYKDSDILTEEYAVRVDYDDVKLYVVLSYFKTAI